jgi:hypothetical protein
MDDDDYYPPERVSHAVESLMANPSILCAGSSEIYIYFKHLKSLMQFGPYGPNHATAGTFAFRRELLTHTKYNDDACLAEERFFLKDYTIPMLQLDPTKVILVFSHNHNTFDKRKLLVNANPAFVKSTNKTLDNFIRGKTSMFFKDFFINKMDTLLEAYAPGKPEMKPDVLKQTKELEQTLIRMQEQQQQQQQHQQQQQNGSAEAPAILMHQEGKEPVALTSDQVLSIIQTQQTEIKTLTARISLLETEKTKSESMLYNMVSVCAECTEPGIDSNSKSIIEQCLKDITERDDKLKKTKALYIKSIGETSDLKRQMNELRCQIQEIQGAAVKSRHSGSEVECSSGKSSDPIRLVIDE